MRTRLEAPSIPLIITFQSIFNLFCLYSRLSTPPKSNGIPICLLLLKLVHVTVEAHQRWIFTKEDSVMGNSGVQARLRNPSSAIFTQFLRDMTPPRPSGGHAKPHNSGRKQGATKVALYVLLMKCADVSKNLCEETAIHGHKWEFIVSIFLYQASPQIVSWLLLPVFELLLLSAQTPAKWKAFHDPGPLDGMPGAWYCCWPKLCTIWLVVYLGVFEWFYPSRPAIHLQSTSPNLTWGLSAPFMWLTRAHLNQVPGRFMLVVAWHVCFCNVSKLLHFLPFKNNTDYTFSDKHCNSIGQDKNQLTSSARIDQNLNQVDERSPITRASIPRYSNPSGSFQKMCGYPNNWKFLSGILSKKQKLGWKEWFGAWSIISRLFLGILRYYSVGSFSSNQGDFASGAHTQPSIRHTSGTRSWKPHWMIPINVVFSRVQLVDQNHGTHPSPTAEIQMQICATSNCEMIYMMMLDVAWSVKWWRCSGVSGKTTMKQKHST